MLEHVLFVCTGNTCRSPMAEAIYNHLAQERNLDTIATSAGVMAYDGMPASMGAQCAVQALGADLSFHEARTVDALMLTGADLVLCMQDTHARALSEKFPQFREKIHPLTQYAFGKYTPIADPFGADREIYDYTAKQIREAILKILEK